VDRLDDRGVDRRRRRAGRGHRWLDRRAGLLGAAAALRTGRDPAALPPAAHRRRRRGLPHRRRRCQPDHPECPTRGGTIMIRRSRLLSTLAVTCAAALLVSACGGRQQPAAAPGGADASACQAGTGQITIATGNSTGVYYALGGGLANLISQNTSLKATAAETGASVQNIQQLVAGEYNIAFSLADTAADAVRGHGAFTAPQQVQALGRIYSNYTHVVVQRAAGITTMADFRGKRISTGSPKSGTEVIANRLLQSAGLDPAKDVSPQRLELGKTVDAMKDGSIDGF